MPILTARVGDNSELFRDVASVYLHPGNHILDMTWGNGVFWKKIDQTQYVMVRNDLAPDRGDVHFDFRSMPYNSESFDSVVLDPPYASRSSKRGLKASIDKGYNNFSQALHLGIFGTEKTMQFYKDGMLEAKRLLRPNGLLLVKCMDEISGGKQMRNHFTIWEIATCQLGLMDEDLFVLVQKQIPAMRHPYQKHARKNNSFLWVFRKENKP